MMDWQRHLGPLHRRRPYEELIYIRLILLIHEPSLPEGQVLHLVDNGVSRLTLPRFKFIDNISIPLSSVAVTAGFGPGNPLRDNGAVGIASIPAKWLGRIPGMLYFGATAKSLSD